jgi:hypothetical protein
MLDKNMEVEEGTTAESGWDYQIADDLSSEIAEKASDLSNMIADEDPESAVAAVDALAAKLSELRAELVDVGGLADD